MRGKGGKSVLKCPIVDKSLEKRKEEVPKVEKSFKEFLTFVDTICTFVVQQGKAMTHNQKTSKFMGHIMEGLGTINSAPSASFAKVTIKARLLDSFVRKETKTK
jgi:hypothetical protein